MATDPEPNAVHYTTTSQGITTITLDRAHKRNAIDTPTAKKLHSAFLRFESDPTQHVAILTGANGTFCSGADLQAAARFASADELPYKSVDGRNAGPMGPSRLQVTKPVIVAIAGYAVAGGLELSLIGDVRIVEEDVVFGVFCRRFGVPLIDGGTVRLPKVVGFGRAMDLILTGRAVGAREALEMGLANRVVPKGKALETAWEMAELLIRFPQETMRRDRDSAYYATFEAKSWEDALRNEFEKGKEILFSEAVVGARRFAAGQGRSGKL